MIKSVKVWAENYGLPRLFWLVWFLPSLLFYLATLGIGWNIGIFRPNWFLWIIPAFILINGFFIARLCIYFINSYGYLLGFKLAAAVSVVFIFAVFIYYGMVWQLIWKSAGNYRGNRVWALLARLAVLVNIIGNLIPLIFPKYVAYITPLKIIIR